MLEGINKIIHSKSRTFLAFCFSFILGVGLFSFADEAGDSLYYLYIASFIIGFLIILLWSDKTYRLILFCILFFIFGGLRFLFSIPSDTPGNIAHYNGETVSFSGWVSDEPNVQVGEVKYIISVMPTGTRRVSGNIQLSLPLYPQYNYGDELSLRCHLMSARDQIDSRFSYSKYLARYGISSICSNPASVQIVSHGKGNFLKRNLLGLKSGVQELVSRLWPEPEASLMAGILYGARSGLPHDLLDDFSKVGISHIIAISGYNITIIAVVLLNLLIFAGLYRGQAFWVVTITIILFVILTGASASVLRAGVMGIVVLIAGRLGRLSRIGNVLVFTAALMLLINPYVLIWDAGFQLSFLATLGLVYLSPVITNVIARNEERATKQSPWLVSLFVGLLRFARNDTFIATLSAIIATLPLILYQFGRLSLVAPLVNIMVLWIIPWLMLFGFVAIVIGQFFHPLAQVIAWVAGLGLKYVIILAGCFGGKSWTATDILIPWWLMILLYITIFMVVIRASEKVSK